MVDRPKTYLKMALKSGIFAEKRTIYNCVFDGKCRKKAYILMYFGGAAVAVGSAKKLLQIG